MDFSILEEYYSPSEVDTVTLPFILDEYTMTVNVDGHENYLLIYSGKNMSKEIVITSVLIKVDNDWKILNFYIGGYKAAGLGAEEWAERASKYYEEGKIVPATLNQQIVMELSQLSPIIPHDNQREYIKNMDKYVEEVNQNYSFPMTILLEDNSEVQLIGVDPGFAGGQFMYIVNYKSAYSTIDGNESLVKKESKFLHEKMVELFDGFEEGVSNIVYKAFEEIPSEVKDYYTYGTVIELDESN